MRAYSRSILTAGILSLIVLVSCANQKQSRQIVIGDETLSVEALLQLRPAGIATEAVLPGIGLQRLLARGDSTAQDALIAQFLDRLNLHSQHVWNQQQAASLFRAARELRSTVNSLTDTATIYARLDSLHAQLSGFAQRPTWNTLHIDTLRDSEGAVRQDAIEQLLMVTFRIDSAEAVQLAAFTNTADHTAMDSTALGKMIAGLVWDSSKVQAQKSSAKTTAEVSGKPLRPDNSALALKYRSYESIRDSITKHIPNIRALYRKELKRDQSVEGVVRVAFRISAAGEVMSARIVQSDISEPHFLKPLAVYVRDIRFQPIPDKVGPMSFEFPFEFKSES